MDCIPIFQRPESLHHLHRIHFPPDSAHQFSTWSVSSLNNPSCSPPVFRTELKIHLFNKSSGCWFFHDNTFHCTGLEWTSRS